MDCEWCRQSRGWLMDSVRLIIGLIDGRCVVQLVERFTLLDPDPQPWAKMWFG